MSARDAAQQETASRRRADDERRWRDWMVAAQAGDREAYRKLLEELSVVIRAFLVRRLGDVPVLDDCVQEALLGVHRARHTYDARRAFRPWLFAIVRHKAVDALRRGAQSDRREVPDGDREIAQTQSPGARRDETLDAARVLEGLDAPFREALVLTKFHGYSMEEAAVRAGISASAMKTRVHRGLRRLRKLLEGEEGP